MGFLSVYRSSVALFFPVLEQQIDNLLFFVFLQSKNRTGGSRPARRLTFVQAATKVSKNALAPSGGHIPLHGFSVFYGGRIWDPALSGRASPQFFLAAKS